MKTKFPDEIYCIKCLNMAFELNSERTNHQERNIFRFNYDEKCDILYLNYFETPYKNWDPKKLEDTMEQLGDY